MSLGIIILNWNQAADTIACLRGIDTWPLELVRIVWVVDNDSTGPDRDQIIEACPDVRLIVSDTNRGFAGGNNLAFRAALATDCTELLLLNNDATVKAKDVLHLQETLRRQPSLGIVGPVLWDRDRPNVLLSAGGKDIGRFLVTSIKESPTAGEIREVDYTPGACVLIRTEVLRTVSLFDEAYFFGGEIADLCTRARQHGYGSAIDGGAHALHSVDRSSGIRSSLHIYYVLRNRFLYVRKFHQRDRLKLFTFWTFHSLRPELQALMARDWARARAIRLAVFDGWIGRFGGQNQRVSKGRLS
jgi:GT2 family glycosyltransferase